MDGRVCGDDWKERLPRMKWIVAQLRKLDDEVPFRNPGLSARYNKVSIFVDCERDVRPTIEAILARVDTLEEDELKVLVSDPSKVIFSDGITRYRGNVPIGPEEHSDDECENITLSIEKYKNKV